jgi:hypothetical protein
VSIGLLGRDKVAMEGPKIWWRTKTVRISFEGEGYAFIDLDQKLEVASGPPGPPVAPFPPALMTETTVQTDVFPKSTFLFHNRAKAILDSQLTIFGIM